MASKKHEIQLSDESVVQIGGIIEHSERNFGHLASQKYEALLDQTLKDIQQNPYRLESKNRHELGDDYRSLHMESSKQHISGETVKSPRHSIVYEVQDDKIEVLGIFHDSQDIKRHLPKEPETAQQHQNLQEKDDQYER